MSMKPDFRQYPYLIMLAVFTAACDLYFQGGNNGPAALLAKAAVYFALFVGFFLATESGLTACQSQTESHSWHRFFRFNRRNIMMLSLVFFAVYFFYLLVFYPGVTTGDTLYQIEDLATGTKPMAYPSTYSNGLVSALMIDASPAATTLIFTLFYQIGRLVGDPNIGLFLYNLLQCAAQAVVFAIIICYMDHLRVPKQISLISTVFFASPVIACYAITMGKDPLFALCFVLYYHAFSWLVLNPGENGGSKKQWILLTTASVLMALMNKKGAALAAAANLCLVFTVSGKKKLSAVLSAFLPYLVVGILLPQLVFPVLGILPGGKQELLGVAFQQTSLSLLEHPEKYTGEEKDLFFSLLDLSQEELKETYDPTITDPIKNRLPYDSNPSKIRDYLNMWASHLPREAGTYIRATLSISGGYFSPHKLFNVYQSTPYSDAIGAFSQPGRTESLRSNVGALVYWLEQIPVFSVFSQDSFYLFWVPAFVFYSFCRHKQKDKIVLLAPPAANILFLVFAPVCITRYGLCQYYTFPMLMAAAAMQTDYKKTRTVQESMKKELCR